MVNFEPLEGLVLALQAGGRERGWSGQTLSACITCIKP